MMESSAGGAQLLRVGVVGCGQVAEHHLRFISQTKGAVIAGLADVNGENARRLGARYGVKNLHGSLEDLLASTHLDVLHVTTPPRCHYSQAKLAIEQGINVLVEKPVTLSLAETLDLYERAAAKGVSICPDFILLFHPRMRGAMQRIKNGLGRVMHCECYVSLDPDVSSLQEYGRLHWSCDLPAGFFHDVLPHPLYLALYWAGAIRRIVVTPKVHGALPQRMTDHLDIMVDGEQATAHVTLSFVTNPRHYYLRMFCENGTVLVNFHTMTVVVDSRSRLPRSVDRAMANLSHAYRLSRSTVGTIVDTLRGKLLPYQGLQLLVPEYYQSLRERREPPVSRALALAVSQAEEAVVSQGGKLRLDLRPRRSARSDEKRNTRVLVTGATGYIGSELVRQLVAHGYEVRALVRPLARSEALEDLGVDFTYGDIRESEDLCRISEGVDIIVHLAAGLRGNRDFIVESCVKGTENVAKAALAGGAKRVIYFSSMGIYDFGSLKKGSVITESTPLERSPERRGAATFAKRRAEDIALSHLNDHQCPWTIIRPSFVLGNHRSLLMAIGLRIGNNLLCLSRRKNNMMLIHVKDVAAAIIKVIESPQSAGQVFNLSARNPVTIQQFIEKCLRKSSFKDVRVLFIPYWMVCCGVLAFKILRAITRRGPRITLRQLVTGYLNLKVESSRIRECAGWEERQDVLEQLAEEYSAV